MRLIMTAKKLTAEELAVKMEMGNHDWADDAAEMLRQQQAEIEALKKEAALQRLSDFTQEVEAKYSDAWWKEVDEFNKQLKAQEK